MTTNATQDLKRIHQLKQAVKKEFSGCSERYLYFLATCFYLDPYLDLDIALQFRDHGRLIGIDNSTLDKHFDSCKILRFRFLLFCMTLPVFVFEHSGKGPNYSHVLPCPATNEYRGHATGIVFCLYVNTSKRNLFSLLEFCLCNQLFLTLKAFDIRNRVLKLMSFLCVLLNTAIQFLFYSQVHSI